MAIDPPQLLIVDDEADTCANLSDIFSDLGFLVDVAYDGPSALKLFEQKAYDVALLDLKMPGMDGLELYRRIRRLSSGTVAIVVTAYANGDTAEAVLSAGAWKILPKPVDLSRLMDLVGQAFEEPLIMMVDDDQDLCDSLWDVLREHGYRTCLAHGLSRATERLAQRDYQVVLIDMKLPEGNGVQVLERVQEANPNARTIVITGFRNEMDNLVQQALASGADAVCYKPFDVHRLLETIQQFAK